MRDPLDPDPDGENPAELPPIEEGGERVSFSGLLDGAPAEPGAPAPSGSDPHDAPSPRDKSLLRFETSPGTLDVTDHPLRYAFGHGRQHGEWRIEVEPYQEYLRQKAEEEALLGEEARCLSSIDEERTLRSRAAALKGDVAAKHVEIRHATHSISRAEARVEDAAQAIKEARSELHALKGRGSWTYVLLYGVAGGVFIAGDVALAKYTVSTALRLVSWEGWVFAVGLALLAFVLKPVYDRLVEDRYHEGKTRAFTWTILATAAFVAGFLLLMGGYRADFMQSNVGLEQSRTELSLVEQQLDRARELEQSERAAELEERRDALDIAVRTNEEAILTNRLGRWALILAQLLFAVAGAICIGLATRNFRDWRHLRRPLAHKLGSARHERDPKRAGELYRRRLAAEDELEAARDRLQAAEQDAERLEAEVAVLESEADALERLEAARSGIASVHEELKDVRKRIYEYLYQTGYALGAKLPEPEVVTTGDGRAGAAPALGLPPSPSTSGSAGRRRHRLYLAVREAVRRAAVPPSDDA